MKLVTWNMDYWKHSEEERNQAWDLLDSEISPDIALLQEAVPPENRYKSHNQVFLKVEGKNKWSSGIISRTFHLAGLDLVSEGVKTCSTTPVMKWFYNKDVDHILARGFKPNKSGVIEGESDHKLIYVDLSRS